jgi:dTDP-glucose 4,6-dehydratase
MTQTLLVTGGAGFIGSHFVEARIAAGDKVIVIDALTYAGNMQNLASLANHPNFLFFKERIESEQIIYGLLEKYQPTMLFNFAAESHVDLSISNPREFMDTNILGTYHLLEATRRHQHHGHHLRFIQISTDEVFGALGTQGYFTENTPYQPSSPYSASKAAADHLVSAWSHTYKLDTIITHCTNNYGTRQYPEKLIPHMITKALHEENLPIYGDGLQIRDWIHVSDHCHGIWLAATKGKSGEHYGFGGHTEKTNLWMVETICTELDKHQPRANGTSYHRLKTHVTDRPGHDRRYAFDDSKSQQTLGYHPKRTLEEALPETIGWYIKQHQQERAA